MIDLWHTINDKIKRNTEVQGALTWFSCSGKDPAMISLQELRSLKCGPGWLFPSFGCQPKRQFHRKRKDFSFRNLSLGEECFWSALLASCASHSYYFLPPVIITRFPLWFPYSTTMVKKLGTLFSNWSLVSLQCCVSFYCTAKERKYMCTYILSFWISLPFRSPQSTDRVLPSYLFYLWYQ